MRKRMNLPGQSTTGLPKHLGEVLPRLREDHPIFSAGWIVGEKRAPKPTPKPVDGPNDKSGSQGPENA
jgi:hypothetical protein